MRIVVIGTGYLGSVQAAVFAASGHEVLREAGSFGEVYLLCVGIPQSGAHWAADTSQVTTAVESLAPHTPYLRTGLATAELIKVAANAFLATKISFVNAMAELCESTDADLVMHLTEWRQYRDPRPDALASIVRTPRLFDGRNSRDVTRWQDSGGMFVLSGGRSVGMRRSRCDASNPAS